MNPVVYLYLAEPAYAETWIGGGVVPIPLASAFKSKERAGTKTPDELLVHRSPVDLKSVEPFLGVRGEIRNLKFTNNWGSGARLPDIVGNVAYYEEDGLVLCFCEVALADIAERLGKKACVRIIDIAKLKKVLDKQIGRRSEMGKCKYTTDHQRAPFLKSVDDSWQQEFRMYWKGATRQRDVKIPPGTADLVAVYQ